VTNGLGPDYKISYDLSYDYLQFIDFIVRSTYDGDLQRATISLGISSANVRHCLRRSYDFAGKSYVQPTVQKPPKSYEKVCETDRFLNKRLKNILLQKIPNFCLDSRTEYSMCALSRTPGLC